MRHSVRKWRDPDILVALANPEGAAAAEQRGFAGHFSLQPVRVILGHAVRAGRRFGGNAFRARDVYESVVAGGVSLLGNCVNGLQLLAGIQKAFVSARNVIVYFDPEDVSVGGPADDLIRVVEAQAVTGDADVVRPVLADLAAKRCHQNEESGEESQWGHWSFTEWFSRFLVTLGFVENLEFEPCHELHLARMESGRQAGHLAKAA